MSIYIVLLCHGYIHHYQPLGEKRFQFSQACNHQSDEFFDLNPTGCHMNVPPFMVSCFVQRCESTHAP